MSYIYVAYLLIEVLFLQQEWQSMEQSSQTWCLVQPHDAMVLECPATGGHYFVLVVGLHTVVNQHQVLETRGGI